MKKLIIITLLFLTSCSSNLNSQTGTLPDKASPFTAVDWEEDIPVVHFNDDWYYFEKLDALDKDQILNYCKEKYGRIWKKRFSEDLIEVLKGMDYIPNIEVELALRKENETSLFKAKLTKENRRSVWSYNVNKEKSVEVKENISQQQAINDLAFLQQNITDHYSYAELKGIDYPSEFQKLIQSLGEEVNVNSLTIEVHKTLSLFGDGHTRVRGISSALGRGYLPFAIAPHNDKVICLNKNSLDFLDTEYPFLHSINGIATEKLLEAAAKLDADGSKQFKTHKSVSRLRYIQYLLEQFNALNGKEIIVALHNNAGQLKEFSLSISPNRNRSLARSSEHQLLESNIGYLRIPEMTSDEEFIRELANQMQKFKNSDGIVIDIRDNPGGSRDILRFLAPYFIPKKHDPIVVNAAVLRTDKKQDNPEGYMSNRYLFPVSSKKLNDQTKASIKAFSKNFNPKWEFPKEKFSQWHYLVLESNDEAYYYDKPVVVLINPNCFSATDIFAAAFKELPNVTLVGESTGGGSGRSQGYTLAHSNIKVRLSSMASFQPNGQLFEGNGVSPDIEVKESISDILRKTDSPFEKAIEIIKD